MTFSPNNTQGPFLPINQTFSTDDDQFLIQITNRDRDIARNINIREIGIYDTTQNPTGQQWNDPANAQNKKQTFRKIFYFSDASLNFVHNITNLTLTTHIYGSFTNGTNFYPLPYVSATAVNNQIQIDVTPTNIVVTKGAGAPPAITNGVIILEYLLN